MVASNKATDAASGTVSAPVVAHAQEVSPVEKEILDSVNIEYPWALVERFSTLVRESGSEGERAAARHIASRLKEWGVPYQLYEPELFLSLPRGAKLVARDGAGEKSYRVKTSAFSVSTGEPGVAAELVYVPSSYAKSVGELFESDVAQKAVAVAGKIVITRGYAMPLKVKEIAAMGATAAVFINPGEGIHEGICTTIWGTPELDNYQERPSIPVLSINRPDGEELLAKLEKGKVEVTVATRLDEGWFTCPLPVVEVPGTEEPEKFLLLHGHLDSWHVGIGDNATGDAAMLEMARVLWQHRDKLRRSVRIAWWPGHSTGRYAGSTWFADQFAPELDENCIAQVNCDSPGCRWARSFHAMEWTSEVGEACQKAICDITGQEAKGGRPGRAGDYSFNNIGITSFYMLSSSMPDELRVEKGYYAVGGCGGNIQWHTEADTLEIADKEFLRRDIKVYLLSILRVVNASVYPFDFRRTVAELSATLAEYDAAAGGRVSFAPAQEELKRLAAELEAFYGRSGGVAARRFNQTLLELARILIPLNFTRAGRFHHDPAVEVPPLPDLAGAKRLRGFASGNDESKFLVNQLTRGRNRVVAALRAARKLVAAAK